MVITEATASPVAASGQDRHDQARRHLARLRWEDIVASPRYIRPGWGTRVFNGLVVLLTRLGISIYGSRILAVRGRASGQWRTTPVNLLDHAGERYLVAPRGVTQWVRNIRASGEGDQRARRSRGAAHARTPPASPRNA